MATGAGAEGGGVPRAARGRAVRDPEPVGRRLGEGARGARVQGARDDELRLRVHARARRRRASASTRSRPTSRALDEATALPVSADLENGYGPAPEDVARRDRRGGRGRGGRRLDRGLRPGGPALRPRARRRAGGGRRRGGARGWTSRSRSPRAPRTTSAATPTSTTRSAGCRRTSGPAPTCSTRPGCAAATEIRAVCAAVAKPVNVLARPGMSLGEIVAAGAQRISVGGGLAWAAVNGLVAAAEELRDSGGFEALAPPARLAEWLRRATARMARMPEARHERTRSAAPPGAAGALQRSLEQRRAAADSASPSRARGPCPHRGRVTSGVQWRSGRAGEHEQLLPRSPRASSLRLELRRAREQRAERAAAALRDRRLEPGGAHASRPSAPAVLECGRAAARRAQDARAPARKAIRRERRRPASVWRAAALGSGRLTRQVGRVGDDHVEAAPRHRVEQAPRSASTRTPLSRALSRTVARPARETSTAVTERAPRERRGDGERAASPCTRRAPRRRGAPAAPQHGRE